VYMKGIWLYGRMICVCVYVCLCRGYGYVEYETQEMAQTAVERMNNLDFCGFNLQVSSVSVIGTLGMCFRFWF